MLNAIHQNHMSSGDGTSIMDTIKNNYFNAFSNSDQKDNSKDPVKNADGKPKVKDDMTSDLSKAGYTNVNTGSREALGYYRNTDTKQALGSITENIYYYIDSITEQKKWNLGNNMGKMAHPINTVSGGNSKGGVTQSSLDRRKPLTPGANTVDTDIQKPLTNTAVQKMKEDSKIQRAQIKAQG